MKDPQRKSSEASLRLAAVKIIWPNGYTSIDPFGPFSIGLALFQINCQCKDPLQDMPHFLPCSSCLNTCTFRNLNEAND